MEPVGKMDRVRWVCVRVVHPVLRIAKKDLIRNDWIWVWKTVTHSNGFGNLLGQLLLHDFNRLLLRF